MPAPAPSDHLPRLPGDLDPMLTAAVRDASDMPIDEADRLTEQLRGLVRPAWLLSPDRNATERSKIGGSRIGGLPDLPEGWQWPTVEIKYRNGKRVTDSPEAALAFTAQINLADVPGAADAGWLPTGGWLWFFRHEGQSVQTEPDHVILHADVPAHELRTTHPPAELDYLGDIGSGPERDRPIPVTLHRTLFLTANYKSGRHSQGYDALAEALDEHFDEDCAGIDLFGDIQRLLERAAVGDKSWDAMLLGRPTPCPPPGGACPCGRSAPADTPGYSNEDGPCSWARDSLLALYDYWGDGPLIFTADATATPATTATPAITDGRWSGTEAWVY
ncbi:DUF1963 domain-containing protein [Streptomyces sp. NPDC018000]|uniref:DUF1963 domain-containing protein n=1 Tax=Streptomyces sp. NPDC018000 TaxID=3365028 RepID=UPI0037A85A5B